LLAKYQRLLDRDLTGALDDVRPAVSQLTKATHFTAVVATHVAPDLVSPIVAESTVDLDMQTKLASHSASPTAPALAAPKPGRRPG